MHRGLKGALLGTLMPLAALGVLGTPVANAAPLEDVVKRVVKENPEILEAAANKRAIDHELRQARGLYRPQVDLSLGAGPEWSLNSTTRARDGRGANDSAGVWRTRLESRITLQQVLFDGFARESEVERQAARVDAAAKRVRERSEFVALDLIEAYLNILRYQAHVDLAKQNVSAHEEHLRNVQERVKAGQRGVGDLQQAQSRLADAKATLVEANRDREEAEIFYRRLLGEEPVDLSRPAVDAGVLPDSVDAAVKTALANNPTLELGAADLDVSKAELSASKSDLYPTVKLEVSASRNNHLDGSDDVSHDLLAMLKMDYNLYRGGIDKAKTHEYMERLSESRGRMLRLERAVEEETRQSWSAMLSAKDRLAALEEQVIANSQVLATYRQEFLVGQRDLVDVLDAENELFTSRTRMVTSDYATLFGAYRVLASTGELLNTLGVKPGADAAATMRDKYGVTPDWRGEGEVPEEDRNPN
jgi:adhesin transport system outer membrane protein